MTGRVLAVLAGLVLLLAPLPASSVERYYSRGLFPSLQRMTTGLSNAVPLSLFDLLLGVAMTALLTLVAYELLRPGRWWRRGLRAVFSVAATASVFYVLFVATWGLNYRRVPLRETLPLDRGRISADASLALARETVAALNALHPRAHAGRWTEAGVLDRTLAAGLEGALRTIGLPGDVQPARPKYTMIEPYFLKAGVSGMTDPFFLETLIPSTLLPFERGFVVAHEWAHLAGYTDEGEANFIGWLACLRGEAAHQYSGWLFLYGEVMSALPADARAPLAQELGEGPRADLSAVRARLAREVDPRVSSAGWQIYDHYLKANRVEAGTASYGEVLQLILGTGLR